MAFHTFAMRNPAHERNFQQNFSSKDFQLISTTFHPLLTNVDHNFGVAYFVKLKLRESNQEMKVLAEEN
jgi:hypothetical protein